MLGFKKGSYKSIRNTYNVDSMPIGECKAGQPLTKCTGGGNAWGNLNYRGGWCKKGQNIGVTVTCDAPVTKPPTIVTKPGSPAFARGQGGKKVQAGVPFVPEVFF